jgi:adenine-specific DNA-methyltransferase
LKAGSSPGDGQAEAKQNGNMLRVAISFGPQHGPVIAHQVQEAIPTAKMNGYQVLLLSRCGV